MNFVLFVNPKNLSSIEAFVNAMATLQRDPINGALVVVHHIFIPQERINDLVAPIRGLFPPAAQGLIQSQANTNYDSDGMTSTMFSMFMMKGYTRFPGPWLVVDGEGVPKVDNFVGILTRQHALSNSSASGRAIIEPGGATPVGPVTLQLPAKSMKMLYSQTGESWRSRGRYIFGRSGFHLVHPRDYVFDLSKEQEESLASSDRTDTPDSEVMQAREAACKLTAKERKAAYPPFNPNALEAPTGPRQVNPVAGVQPQTQEEINQAANAAASREDSIVAPGTTMESLQKEKDIALTQEESALQEPINPMEDVPETPPVPDVQVEGQSEDGGDGEFLPPDLTEVSGGDVPPDARPLMGRAYETLTRNELYNLFWFRSGEKPHPNIGQSTLTRRLEEMDKASA